MEKAIEAKNRGNAAFSAKEYDKAVEAFTEAIQYDPDNYVLYSNRSAAFASLGKYHEALEDANSCIQRKPDWPKGYSRKGAALYGLGRYEEAVAAYEQGLQIEPNNEALLQGKQQAMNQSSSHSTTSRGLFGPETMAQLAMNPTTRKLLQDPSFMQILKEMQQNPSAIGKYLQDPRVMQVLSVLTGMHFDTSQSSSEPFTQEQQPPKEQEEENKDQQPTTMDTSVPSQQTAEENSQPSVTESAEKKQALEEKNLGNEYYKKKQFQQAIEHYNKAIELDPWNLSYLTNRAAAYLEMGELDSCIEDCQKAVDWNKEYNLRTDYKIIARAYARMGNAYAKKQDYDKAIECYEKSLLEYHDDKVYSKCNEMKKLKKKLEEESYIDPELSKVAKEEGNNLYKQGQFPEALQKYTEAIKRNPKDPVPYSNRAATLTKLGQFPSALADCEKCLQLDPQFVRAYARKGAIHFYMKEYHKSLDAYQQGLQVDPNNAELKEGLQKTLSAIAEQQRSEKPDEEQIKHAMADPEIQKILMDPVLQNLLQEAQSNPSCIQKAMSSPGMAAKIQKLVAAGILRIG
jgi:stress-induced-phosphoprotein 1